jgi:hypothetical protein
MSQEITDRREIRDSISTAKWGVTEFDGGNVILTHNQADAQFGVHFDAVQWVAFQALVDPSNHAPVLKDAA